MGLEKCTRVEAWRWRTTIMLPMHRLSDSDGFVSQSLSGGFVQYSVFGC